MVPMAFRSHVGRPFDFRLRSNQAAVGLTLLAGAVAVGLVVFAERSPWLIVNAGGITFVSWALTREIDPDRAVTATLAAIAGGVWVLADFPVALLALGGLILVGRLIVESTGRRPLTTDLIPIAIYGMAISFTAAGWVAGFAIAIAIYLDNRMADDRHEYATVIALVTAMGASAIATLTGAFPQELPEVRPILATALGVLALIAVLREPPTPTSQVDSRRKTFLRSDRLHAARVVVAMTLFAAALLAGEAGDEIVPGAIALALSLASSEIERIQRSR